MFGIMNKGKIIILLFFIDFTENNEIVFEYAKSMTAGQKIIKNKTSIVDQVVIGDGYMPMFKIS